MILIFINIRPSLKLYVLNTETLRCTIQRQSAYQPTNRVPLSILLVVQYKERRLRGSPGGLSPAQPFLRSRRYSPMIFPLETADLLWSSRVWSGSFRNERTISGSSIAKSGIIWWKRFFYLNFQRVFSCLKTRRWGLFNCLSVGIERGSIVWGVKSMNFLFDLCWSMDNLKL